MIVLGSCYGGMIAEVYSNGDFYEMKYRYYIIDLYEWAGHEIDADTLFLMLHRLQEIGLSHQYLFAGYYEGTISWKKGQTRSVWKTIQCSVDESRKIHADEVGFNKARKEIEGYIKRTYMRGIQAPMGVKPRLITWMQIS